MTASDEGAEPRGLALDGIGVDHVPEAPHDTPGTLTPQHSSPQIGGRGGNLLRTPAFGGADRMGPDLNTTVYGCPVPPWLVPERCAAYLSPHNASGSRTGE